MEQTVAAISTMTLSVPPEDGNPSVPPFVGDPPPIEAVDAQICRQCAGLCCQGHPGLWIAPQRFADIFFPDAELTMSLLLEKMPALGLELRRIGGIPVPAPRRSPEGCHFLGETGCLLDADRRPCQCLALTPAIDTLIDGEIRCRMPQGFGGGEGRKRWERFWRQQGRR
ncbi:MAG: hypothetical protein GWO11_07135 [Desulfuromonadales bacterium]|nr:hypothetical protein [Desulfuromonadales bacterium]NIR34109.1 hypothetical protein [Desulfuromonadales bacterium]NIS41565.1 hypothetical protein [Desulfuromonadales bacterium]